MANRDILPTDALPDTSPQGLGDGFLGGKALGQQALGLEAGAILLLLRGCQDAGDEALPRRPTTSSIRAILSMSVPIAIIVPPLPGRHRARRAGVYPEQLPAAQGRIAQVLRQHQPQQPLRRRARRR